MTDILSAPQHTHFVPAEPAVPGPRADRRRRTRAPRSIALDLAAVGRRFYARGWVLGTSGNFSAVTGDTPLRLIISASSVHKGRMRPEHVLEVDEHGESRGGGASRPSAETRLHLEIVRRRGARAVLHTHSVWGTMLSDAHADRGGLAIEGYEMLKGLRGVGTHTHSEWIPIIENDQDMTRLAARVGEVLAAAPGAHALLLHRHGLYTWGDSLDEAERHVEILEFLFETLGRTATYSDARRNHGTATDP